MVFSRSLLTSFISEEAFLCLLMPFACHCWVWISCFHPAVVCSFTRGVRLCLKRESMKSEALSSDASPALNLLCVMLSKLYNLIVSFLPCLQLGTGIPVRWAYTIIVTVPPKSHHLARKSKCYIKVSLLTNQVCKKHLLSSWKQTLCKVCSQSVSHLQFEIQNFLKIVRPYQNSLDGKTGLKWLETTYSLYTNRMDSYTFLCRDINRYDYEVFIRSDWRWQVIHITLQNLK